MINANEVGYMIADVLITKFSHTLRRTNQIHEETGVERRQRADWVLLEEV